MCNRLCTGENITKVELGLLNKEEKKEIRIKLAELKYKKMSAEEKLTVNDLKIKAENKKKYQIWLFHKHERERCKIYRNSPAGKAAMVKNLCKRRSLGYNPINEHFPGSHYHHLRYDANGIKDDDIGIFIPKKLHKSIYHNGFTGQGMDKINKVALEWYMSQKNNK
jgi:hypothetical protein